MLQSEHQARDVGKRPLDCWVCAQNVFHNTQVRSGSCTAEKTCSFGPTSPFRSPPLVGTHVETTRRQLAQIEASGLHWPRLKLGCWVRFNKLSLPQVCTCGLRKERWGVVAWDRAWGNHLAIVHKGLVQLRLPHHRTVVGAATRTHSAHTHAHTLTPQHVKTDSHQTR